MKTKYVVTGATGFVGRNLIRYLIDIGNEVTAITTNFSISNDIYNFIKGAEIVSISSLSEISENTIKDNIVIHCAWNNVKDISNLSHYFHLNEQINFIYNLSKFKPKKVIIIGSCYEFGLTVGPVSVKDLTLPNTPYAQSKDFLRKISEEILYKNTKINFTWARLFYVFGNGQHENSFYSQLSSAIDRGDKIFNMSKGEQLFDYMDITKVVESLYFLVKKDAPQIVHICNGYPISLRSLAEKIIKDRNSKLKLNLGYYPYRENDSIAIWGAESFDYQMQKNGTIDDDI